jgi:hypothetical protein
LKPQRRKRLQEGVKLLNDDDTPNAHEGNNKHDLKALEQGQLENGKIDANKQDKVKKKETYSLPLNDISLFESNFLLRMQVLLLLQKGSSYQSEPICQASSSSRYFGHQLL